MADHNGRTIWFHGPAGPMAPKGNACSYAVSYRNPDTIIQGTNSSRCYRKVLEKKQENNQ